MPAARLHTYKMIRSLWSAKNIAEQLYKKSPILGMVTKDENFGEEYRYISVGTGGPQGLGDFDNARRNKTASTAEEFRIGEASYYGEFSIDGPLYRKAKRTGNVGLLKNPLTRDSKNLMVGAMNDFSSFVHGNGGGALGRTTTASDYTTQTVTLTAGADKRRILKGMTLWAATTDGSTGTQIAGSVKVASVQGTATAPTITVEQASWTAGMPSLAAATQYYLFRAGAFGTGTVFTGLDTWLPAWTTDSGGSGTPAALNGVTRANAPEQLAGINLDLRGKTPRQRVMLAGQACADTGQASSNLIYCMNTDAWTNLSFELMQAGQLIITKAPAAKIGGISYGIEYDAITLITAAGTLKIVADPWMPAGVERLLDLDTFVMMSVGPWFGWDEDVSPDDPLIDDSADARTVRANGDHQFYCINPWPNVRVRTA
jgi:hypothetical protein